VVDSIPAFRAAIIFGLNGEPVVGSVQSEEGMVTVTSPVSGWGTGSTNLVELRFMDNVGVARTESWSYAISGDGVPRLELAAEVVGPCAWEVSAVTKWWLRANMAGGAACGSPRFA
jgi:hypothetical protein